MNDIDVEALRHVGLTPETAGSAAEMTVTEDGRARLWRVTEVHRDGVRLHDGRDEFAGRPLPRLERSLADEEDALAVGDWVLGETSDGTAWVQARVPPRSQLARRDGEGRRRILVSNVDVALLVMGLDGDFNPRRLERYLALVHGSGVVPVIVLSKADLVGDDERDERMRSLRARVPAHVALVAVDATSVAAAEELMPWLGEGRTLVLLGSSGAGKSTLTNTLLGHGVQATGAVREHDSRGRHTTTARSLFVLPAGGCVIDTPGLRALRPDADEDAVAASFADIESLAGRCRFRDCRHLDEPGCAVRAGIDGDRLRNYHKLLREVRRDTMTALDRQRQRSEWKARGKAAQIRMKAKGRL